MSSKPSRSRAAGTARALAGLSLRARLPATGLAPLGGVPLAVGPPTAPIIDGDVLAAKILGPAGGTPDLPAQLYPVLLQLPAARPPRPRQLTGYGNSRLLAQRMPDGYVLVTGLPLSEVDST